MSSVPAADEPGLPERVHGSQSPLWWGMVLLIVIEATVYASLLVTYFYLRLASPDWPPAGIGPPELLLPTIATALLVASAAPAWWADRGIRRGDRRRLGSGLLLGMAMAAAYPVLVVLDLNQQDYSWATNVYGSVVWTINGYGMMHAIGVVLLAGVVAAIGWRGHFHEHRRVGVQVTALYWYFVAAGALAFYLTVYLGPYIL